MSGLRRLIREIHRRSLWQVLTRARHRSLLACVSCLALTVLACGRGDDTAYSRGSTVIISYCCNEALNHDPEARDTVYRRINQILRRDMPVTFFFPRTDAWWPTAGSAGSVSTYRGTRWPWRRSSG